VLDKFTDLNSSYVGYADETGSFFYHAHPDMYLMLEQLGGEAQQREVGWLINKQVIQPRIDNGLPFEYTLKEVDPDKISKEKDAIMAIWNKAGDAAILDALADSELKDLPGRIKELKLLYASGYQISLDTATNSYILIKP
jgi:hypothetical protein